MASQERVTLPAAFEQAEKDHLALLIGEYAQPRLVRGSYQPAPTDFTMLYYNFPSVADMLQRLMTHNDQIPLSP